MKILDQELKCEKGNRENCANIFNSNYSTSNLKDKVYVKSLL